MAETPRMFKSKSSRIPNIDAAGSIPEVNETASAVEAFILAAGDALWLGAPIPRFDNAELDDRDRAELSEVQDCLQLLDDARRERWFGDLTSELTNDSSFEELKRVERTKTAHLDHFDRIGRFEIIRELGRGGHGVVFLARDPDLRRLVALKVARPECLLSNDLRRRFHREAQAAGSLQHPHLIKIYEVGVAGPVSYIASEYCSGPTLQQWMLESRRQPTDRESAALIAALAKGVHHAHEAGILHRDIKPSNVLLDLPRLGALQDETSLPDSTSALECYVPKLADFGLAKLLDSEDDQTRTGAVIGTPTYMSPEQASGQHHRIGPTTDVYGLGVLLYEMLVGRPPLHGENDVDTARKVCEDEPISPRRFRPSLDRDLEAICLHCLEKKPEARYPTALYLAEDLFRYLEFRPTIVRPIGYGRSIARSIRRRPLPAALIALSIAFIVVVSSGGWLASMHNEQALQRESILRSKAEASSIEAQTSSEEARRLLYTSDMMLAYHYWDQSWSDEASALLARHQQRSGYEWKLLASLNRTPHVQVLSGHQGTVNELAVFPGGDKFASVGDDGRIGIWDVATGACPRFIDTGDDPLHSVAISPDGRRLIAGSKAIYIVDVDSGEVIRTIDHGGASIESLAFDIDGRQFVAGSRYDELCIFDLEGNRIHRRPWTSRAESVEFMPDGTTIVAPGRLYGGERITNTVVLMHRDLSDLTSPLTWSTTGNAALPTVARPSPSGKCLAIAERYASTVTLLDAISGQPIAHTPRYRVRINDVAWSPIENRVAACYENGTVRIYDAVHRYRDAEVGAGLAWFDDRVWTIDAHEGNATCVRFMNPDMIVTCGSDESIKLWRFESTVQEREFSLPSTVIQAAQSPDGNSLAVACRDELIMIDVESGEIQFRHPVSKVFYSAVAWSPRGDVFAHSTIHKNGASVMRPDGSHIYNIEHPGEVSQIAFSPDSETVALIGTTHLQLCRTNDGSVVRKKTLEKPGISVAFSPSEDLVAYGGEFSAIVVEDYHSLLPHLQLTATSPVTSLAFNGDGTKLASGHVDGGVCVWNVHAGKLEWRAAVHELSVSSIAFSPDGHTLLSAAHDGTLRVSSVDAGRCFGTLLRRTGPDFSEPCRFSLVKGGDRLAVSYERSSDRPDLVLFDLNPAATGD